MSYIGATGLDENQEQFDILKDEIDGLASYQNTITGYPDPTHTAIFGINPLNPNLFGLVERAEVKIKLLETAEEGLGTDLTGLTTQVEGIQTEVTGIQTEILGIQGEITGIDSSISAIQFVQIPALGVLIGTADGIAVDARNKANRALDIWDYSGDNTYNKKAGNVGIGTTFGSVLTNKLEVNGNINIPTGSTFRINNEPFNYSHLAGTQPVSSKWTNSTDVDTNIYYNSGNVGIGVTTAINNKLEVNGNLNISAGSKYKINNVNLAFSDLGGTLSYNSLTNQLSGGTNIQILNGVINNTYELPKATTNAIGGVRPDGSTITINTSTGVISASAGAAQVNSDWTQTNTSLKSFIQNKPTAGTNISLANNTITNIITGSPTQNIITLNDNYLIVKDKPDSQIVSQVDVPLTSGNEPTITSPAFTESIRTFTHSGGTEAQTSHTIIVGQNTICDILIVGGGGCGGRSGGGGGAVIYTQNVLFPTGAYSIKVGNGGISLKSGNVGNTQGANGNDSEILFNTTTIFRAKGGGFGGPNNSTAGGTGGSGGGSENIANNSAVSNANIISTNTSSSSFTTLTNQSPNGSTIRGNIGGKGAVHSSFYYYLGGGGGGAGSAGGNGNTTNATSGSGGDGVNIDITGSLVMYGSGGAGGIYNDYSPFMNANNITAISGSVSSGGGTGAYASRTQSVFGSFPTAGRGGGGGGWSVNSLTNEQIYPRDGGSGIVIIKFKTIVNTAIPEGNPITHKTLNFTYEPKYPTISTDNTNLKAWYKFDGNYNDSSGSGFNLTNSGAVIVDGLIVQSVSTDASDFLQTSSINLAGKTYSISFWAKLNTTPSANAIFFQQGITGGSGLWLSFFYHQTTNTLRFSHYGSGNDIDTAGYNMSSMIGTSWHHYVATYNNTNRAGEIWFDGVKLNTNISTLANVFSGSGNFNILRSESNIISTLNGLMEDFRYYDKVLTSTEISQLYNIPTQNTYTLSVQAGTSIQVNNQPAQYLSGNYTISVGAMQSSVVVAGIGQVGTDPYPLQNGSTIAIRYSMLQRITSTINIKKDGLIKYVPASGTNPTTGSWNIIDLDTQPLTQFSGNLPANRLDNIDMSKVATGTLPLSRTTETLPISRITGNYEGTIPINLTSGNLPASRLDNIDMGKVATGNLYYNRVQDFYLGINSQFHRIVYAHENIVDTQGIWTNKFKINTNLHLNQYNLSYNYYQYFLSMSPNNVPDRHRYWFGVVKMSTIVGTDNPPNTQSASLRSDSNTNFDIRGTSSTSGVWWLDVWVYTTAYCESLIAILH